jgi:flagellar biosynthesis chaperone FliJ
MRIRGAVKKVLEVKKHRQRQAENMLSQANEQKEECNKALEQEQGELNLRKESLASYEAELLAKTSAGMSLVLLRQALHHEASLEGEVVVAQQAVTKREDELTKADKAVDSARLQVTAAIAAKRKMESLDERYQKREMIWNQAIAEAEQDSEPPRPMGGVRV